jgi:hypothetical protein
MNNITIPAAWFDHKARHAMMRRLDDLIFVDGTYLRLLVERKRCLETKVPFNLEEIETCLPKSFIEAAAASGVLLAGAGEINVLFEDMAFKMPRSLTTGSRKKPMSEIETRLEALYGRYPKRDGGPMGKATGMKKALVQFKTLDELTPLERAVENVVSMLASGAISAPQFVPQWATFMNRWRDYLPENTQQQKQASPF